MIDIMKFAVTDTAQLELNDAKGRPMVDEKGTRACVTIHGPGSKIFEQAEAEMNRVIRQKMAKSGGKLDSVAEGAEERATEFLAAITASFDGWEYPHPDGKWKTPREMFKAAYSNRKIGFIRKQVDDFQADWGNFSND